MRSRRLQADLLLVLVCFFWGSTFVLVKEAIADVSTLLFLTLRFSVAAVALFALGGRPSARDLVPGFWVGLFLFLGYFFQTQGLRSTTASKSAFITGLAVVLVPLLHGFLTRTFPGKGVLGGVALALVGLVLLTKPGVGASINRGDLWTLGGMGAFAIQILLVGHYSPQMKASSLTAGQVATAAALGAMSFPWAEQPVLRSTPSVWAAVLVTALLCTALGFWAQAWAQQSTTPTHVALIFSTEPVFAWMTSAVLLGERLDASSAAGAFLILAGILMVELL